MKEPFDPRVHGPQVGMGLERRQLPLQRCHGHVAPISYFLDQVQQYARSFMIQPDILKNKWKKDRRT